MTNLRTITLFSLAVLVSLALIAQAKNAAQPQQTSTSLLASKLIPQTKARTSRSLSDMFEKVKSKIFGNKKQASAQSTNAQIQPAASVNSAQRLPFGDMNSFNQQYNPYSSLSGSNYQWPASQASNQFLGQQYNSAFNGFAQSPSSNYQGIGQAAPGASNIMSGLDATGQSGLSQATNTNSNTGSNGGLLTSASQLLAQYLSPPSGSSSAVSPVASAGSQNGQVSGQANQQNQFQQNGQGQNLLNPQQQQSQSQYNEFASMLDTMVSQVGASPLRQPSSQYMQPSGTMQQAQQGIQSFQSGPAGNMMGSGQMVGDNDMSGSSNVQSYMPAASAQPASAKSSMVGLAEQLAPGATFNKLVSFPFSLSNNDDPSKDGKFKLHIPFLNSHVKRSDQQQQVSQNSAAQKQQQQQQQYLNYYNQQAQQQMVAQASQVVPTVVSPQQQASSPGQSVQSASAVNPSSTSSVSVSQSSSSSSSSSQASPSVSASSSLSSSQQSPSSSIISSSSNPSPVSSSVNGQQNSRPAWSVADLQSSSSSSKLIPMQSAASSSVEAGSPSQS